MIFDLGEVLVTPSGLIKELATKVERDPIEFSPAYWRRRLEYDLGLSASEYWAGVLDALDVSVSARMMHDLIRIDSRAWTALRPDAAQLLERLHRNGLRVGILSNATIEMAEEARTSRWSRWVTDWFFSAELGLAKPDLAIFQYVTAALDVSSDSIVYIDDSPASTAAAKEAGWDAHLWTSGADTVALLNRLHLLAT